jgi:hypothetical protein
VAAVAAALRRLSKDDVLIKALVGKARDLVVSRHDADAVRMRFQDRLIVAAGIGRQTIAAPVAGSAR